MERIYVFTKAELIEAFNKWNKEFDLKPDDFQDGLN